MIKEILSTYLSAIQNAKQEYFDAISLSGIVIYTVRSFRDTITNLAISDNILASSIDDVNKKNKQLLFTSDIDNAISKLDKNKNCVLCVENIVALSEISNLVIVRNLERELSFLLNYYRMVEKFKDSLYEGYYNSYISLNKNCFFIGNRKIEDSRLISVILSQFYNSGVAVNEIVNTNFSTTLMYSVLYYISLLSCYENINFPSHMYRYVCDKSISVALMWSTFWAK